MEVLKQFVPLRDFCRKNQWPRLAQWQHWITTKNLIAKKCVKKVGRRYLVDLEALETYLKNATLDDDCAQREIK